MDFSTPMTNRNLPHHRTTIILRWIARTLGTLIASFWLIIFTLAIIHEPSPPRDPESIIMTTLIVSSIIVVVIAWFHEILGGILLIVVAVAHSVFAFLSAGHNKGFAVLISGSPFLVIGFLFVVCGWRSAISRRTVNGA